MFYHELLGVGMSVRARTHQGGVGLLPELVLRVDVVSRGKSELARNSVLPLAAPY